MHVNLTVRNDTGRLNTSPVTTMTPIVRLKWGCNHTITIPGRSKVVPHDMLHEPATRGSILRGSILIPEDLSAELQGQTGEDHG